MFDEKPTSARYMDASRANYSELDTGKHQEMVSKRVQKIALENGKQGTIALEKVDVKKSTLESNVINQHTSVEPDIDEETAVPKMLYEGSYSTKELFVKNTTEKVMMDTGQYYDTHDIFMDKDMRGEVVMMVPSTDLDRTTSWVSYVRVDSSAVSKVNGVKTLQVYDLVKATKVVYYRKNSWDQCNLEDPDHRMVTTMTLIIRSDYISGDHNGKQLFYKFKDKIGEKYNVRLCSYDYICLVQTIVK